MLGTFATVSKQANFTHFFKKFDNLDKMIMGLCYVGLSSVVVVVVCVPHIFFLFSLFTLLLSSCIAYTFILNFIMQQINVLKRHKYTYASVIFHVCICYLILSIYKRVQCRGVLLHCYYIVM